MSSWRKFWRLPCEERSLFLRAAVLLPVVRLGLQALGLKRVVALLRGLLTAAPAGNSDDRLHQSRRAARLVAVAARYIGGSCLAQSLVLAWLLERRGILGDLRIGVRKGERGFEAHAWVEVDGAALNDGQDIAKRFASFDRSFALARGNWR